MPSIIASLALLAALTRPVPVPIQSPALTVHDIFGTREYASNLVDADWMRDGAAYTILDTDDADRTNLYKIDVLSGTRTLLVNGGDLVPANARQPLDIDGYQFSRDGSKVLLYTNSARVWRQNTKGTYYVWDLAS